MVKEIRVGFLTSEDPADKQSWSGTHYSMFISLKKEFNNVVPLGPIKDNLFLKTILYAFNFVLRLIFRKGCNKSQNLLRSYLFASKFEKILKKQKIDVIFAPAASTEIAFLKTKIPICYLSDTSFGQINDYYKRFSSLFSFSIKESNIIENKAIKKSKTQVYSSDWAAQYVIKNYHADPDKVFVVKFGANLNPIPDRNTLVRDFSKSIQLFFIGVDWERKGGAIVIETLDILIKKGYDISLVVCGCIPPVEHPQMKVIPKLDKNNEKDNKRLNQLFNDSHILFIPTRADCTPIVFCEAAAYGLPIITTDTGGVSSIVENGQNGFALPLSASADNYANTIMQLINQPEKLNELSQISRKKYETEFNWDVWAKKMKEILSFTAECQ